MANQDDVWDREELKGAILSTIAGSGRFVCLLGGKSTGKTLVTRYLEKSSLGNVFVVNLRVEGSDILTGLIEVLKERREYYLDLLSQGDLNVAKAVGGLLATFTAKEKQYEAFSKFLTSITDNINMKQPLKVLINELLARVEGKITIIIDEANMAFGITSGTKQENIDSMKGILATFTQLTKENRKV
jgi:hypothetical protein